MKALGNIFLNITIILLKIIFFPVDLIWDLWRILKSIFGRVWHNAFIEINGLSEEEAKELRRKNIYEPMEFETKWFASIAGYKEE